MGRKGSKRRGRREAGGAAAVGSPPAKQTKLVPDGGDGDRRASSGRGGESLKAMPWTRWTGGELHNAKAEHQALANWKRGSFTSAAFEAYYRRQLSSHAPRGLLPEVEWPAFLSALRRPLPATFRLNPAHPAGATLLRRLRDGEFDLPPASTQQGRVMRSWRWRGLPLPGYLVTRCCSIPGGGAWQLGVDRAGFRAARKLPLGEALYTALAAAAAEGGAERQEVVSMLPALLLGPLPGHRVADLCASPGSKTGQLLEAVRPFASQQGEGPQAGLLEGSEEEGEMEEEGGLWEAADRSRVRDRARAGGGLVVANDLDRSDRIPVLVQRLSCRPKHERAGLVVCCLSGEALPTPRFPSAFLPAGSHERGYDRVLVDAPCSGDGTIRKAADVLRRWSPEPGLKLHAVQLALLRHALEITREGGRVVYSTCTFNPIENEAVVAAALSTLSGGPGSCVLLDAHAEMARLQREEGLSEEERRSPRLVLRPGLRRWAVADIPAGAEALRWHGNAADARRAGMDHVAATMLARCIALTCLHA